MRDFNKTATLKVHSPNEKYRSYGEFLQEKFGGRVHKVPVNVGFTCPNRDGALTFGGCTYCNINGYTPEAARAKIPINEQIESGINYLKQRFKAKSFIIYFQPYSNTYAPLEKLIELYEQAIDHPDVVGISIGTRPDCVNKKKLDYLGQLTRDYFVTLEYGIESVHDETLRQINRGHDYQCTVHAILETAKHGINVCGHLIFGFPQETKEQMFTSVEEISKLPLDFIKIHNLHIVRFTELARQFAEKPFPVFSFKEWIDFVCQIIAKLNPDFIIERLYGDAPKNLLVEPKWCKEKSAAQVIYAVQQRLLKLDTYQGKYYFNPNN